MIFTLPNCIAMTHATAQTKPQVDRELARKLESVHGWCVAQYAASLQRMCPQVGAAVLEIAGGVAIYAGPSPFSFMVGAGMDGPVRTEDLEHIEEFFASRQHAARIDVTPYSDPSLSELLLERGYRVSEMTAVLVRELQSDLPPVFWPENIAVRWAEPGDCERWVDVVAKCFFVHTPGPEQRANMAAMFSVPHSLNVLATCGGTLAGVAGGMIPDDREVAPLFASATLPQFRRNGIHGAMLQFRLAQAKAEGCKLAMITATPGSTSERNLHRHGFVACYEKVTWERQ